MSNSYSSRCMIAPPPLPPHNTNNMSHILTPNEIPRCEYPSPMHQQLYFINTPNLISGNHHHANNIHPPFVANVSNISSSFGGVGEETTFQYGSPPTTTRPFNPEANEFQPTQLQKQLWFYTVPTTPSPQQQHQSNQSFLTNHCSSSIPIDNQYQQHLQQSFNPNLLPTNQKSMYCPEQMILMNHEPNAPTQVQQNLPQTFVPIPYVNNQASCPTTTHWMPVHPEPRICPAMMHQQQAIMLNNNNNNSSHHHYPPPLPPPSHFPQIELNKKGEGNIHNIRHSFPNYKSRPYNSRIMTNRVKTETVILSPPHKTFHSNCDPTLNVNAQEFYPLFSNTNISEDQKDCEIVKDAGKKNNQHNANPTSQNYRITRANQQSSHACNRNNFKDLEQTWKSLAKQEDDQSHKHGQN